MNDIQIVLNRFPQLAGQFDQMVETALDAGVLTCIAVADPLTPVDTGALVGNKSVSGGKGEREITWNQGYAGFQNFGTSRGVPANHFAEQGMDAAAPVVASHLQGFGS